MTTEERIECRTPTPGKQPTRIAQWKFDCLRTVILDLVPESGEGLVAKDLPALVDEALDDNDRANLGSVAWYTTTVKLELEVRGELVRVPKARPQRLLRAR